MGFVFPHRQVAQLLQRGLCLAAVLSGYAALWLLSARPHIYLTPRPHNLEAHVGSLGWWQLRSVGVELPWQTKESRRAAAPHHFCAIEETSEVLGICETENGCPNNESTGRPTSGCTRAWERNLGLLRPYTLLNTALYTYSMHQEQISQGFFLWD